MCRRGERRWWIRWRRCGPTRRGRATNPEALVGRTPWSAADALVGPSRALPDAGIAVPAAGRGRPARTGGSAPPLGCVRDKHHRGCPRFREVAAIRSGLVIGWGQLEGYDATFQIGRAHV